MLFAACWTANSTTCAAGLAAVTRRNLWNQGKTDFKTSDRKLQPISSLKTYIHIHQPINTGHMQLISQKHCFPQTEVQSATNHTVHIKSLWPGSQRVEKCSTYATRQDTEEQKVVFVKFVSPGHSQACFNSSVRQCLTKQNQHKYTQVLVICVIGSQSIRVTND